MFGFFSNKQHGSNIAYDEAVIIEIDFAGLDQFGTDEQKQAVKSLEEELEGSLKAPEGLDGDEFGEGQALIYLYGPSADKIFEKVQPVLKRSPFSHITITLQYGLPDDPNTKEKTFSL